MKSSLTSRYKKNYKVKYYHDINIDTKKWEIVELPSKRIIRSCKFKEDAEHYSNVLNKNKPFGDYGFPNFLTYK